MFFPFHVVIHPFHDVTEETASAHTVHPNSMTLQELPTELVSWVGSFLDPFSPGLLRLTSRELCEKTHSEYERRILDQRWMLSEDSLLNLLDVVNKFHLRHKVGDLRISTYASQDFIVVLNALAITRYPTERLSAYSSTETLELDRPVTRRFNWIRSPQQGLVDFPFPSSSEAKILLEKSPKAVPYFVFRWSY